MNSLSPVEVRSRILELRLVTPVFGLSREKNLSHRLGSDKMSNIVKLYKLGIKMIDKSTNLGGEMFAVIHLLYVIDI